MRQLEQHREANAEKIATTNAEIADRIAVFGYHSGADRNNGIAVQVRCSTEDEAPSPFGFARTGRLENCNYRTQFNTSRGAPTLYSNQRKFRWRIQPTMDAATAPQRQDDAATEVTGEAKSSCELQRASTGRIVYGFGGRGLSAVNSASSLYEAAEVQWQYTVRDLLCAVRKLCVLQQMGSTREAKLPEGCFDRRSRPGAMG